MYDVFLAGLMLKGPMQLKPADRDPAVATATANLKLIRSIQVAEKAQDDGAYESALNAYGKACGVNIDENVAFEVTREFDDIDEWGDARISLEAEKIVEAGIDAWCDNPVYDKAWRQFGEEVVVFAGGSTDNGDFFGNEPMDSSYRRLNRMMLVGAHRVMGIE